MRQYYVILNGRKVGPYPHQEIVRAVNAGRIGRDAHVIDEATEKTFRAGELADNPPVEPKPSVHIPSSGGEPKKPRRWLLNDKLVSDEEAIAAMRAEEGRLRAELRERGLPDDVPIFKHDPATTLEMAYREGGGRLLPVPGVPQSAPDGAERIQEPLESQARRMLAAVRAQGFTPPPGHLSVLEWYLIAHDRHGPSINLIPADPAEMARLACTVISMDRVAEAERLMAQQTNPTPLIPHPEVARVQRMADEAMGLAFLSILCGPISAVLALIQGCRVLQHQVPRSLAIKAYIGVFGGAGWLALWGFALLAAIVKQ